MKQCRSCDSVVSDDFARVFGDNKNTVHNCPFCQSLTEMKAGGAADPDHEKRTQGTASEGRFA